MVDIVLLQTVSILVTSAGLLLAALYYVLQIRHQTRIRKTDLLVRLYSTMLSKDWLESWDRVVTMQSSDLNKIRAEHGMVDVNAVLGLFDEIGVLAQMRLVDVEFVEKMFHGHVERMWEKMKPIAEQGRKLWNDPHLGRGFELLYNEMKKREQKPQKPKA